MNHRLGKDFIESTIGEERPMAVPRQMGPGNRSRGGEKCEGDFSVEMGFYGCGDFAGWALPTKTQLDVATFPGA